MKFFPRYNCLLFLAGLFLVFGSQIATGQELPPIVNYAPSDYGADNQNWMLDQNDDGTIYSANNKGLLVFNGAQWQLYPSPNATILRSVKVVGDRVYTGADMEFGYWQRDVVGALLYTSLVDVLSEAMIEGEEIWNIIAYRDKILFQSLNRIYIYQLEQGKIRVIAFENTIHRLFQVEDELYFQEINKGVFAFKNGDIELLNDLPTAQTETFVNLFKIDGVLRGITQSGNFYILEKQSIRPWNIAITEQYASLSVYNAIQLRNGDIALGTISSGLLVIDSFGNLRYKIKQENGLGNNTALALFEDKDANIWIGLDNGIDCINNHLPFAGYVDRDGKIGTTYTAIYHKGYTYLGTNQGLFYKSDAENEYTLVPNTERQVWMLKRINNTLFCGHNSGTFIIEGANATKIADVAGTWNIVTIPGHPELLLQGNYTGLYVLERDGKDWKLRNKISGFDVSSKFFEFAEAHKILVSNEYKGVFEVEVDDAFAKAVSYKQNTSVLKGEHAGLVRYDDQVFYANKEGIYAYNTEEGIFEKNESLSQIYANDYVSGKLLADATGKLWAFTQNHLVYFTKDNLEEVYAEKKIRLPQGLRNTVKGYEHVTPLKGKTYLLGTVNGYLLVDLSSLPEKTYRVSIQGISKRVREESPTSVSSATHGTFTSKENNIAFSFSAPSYNKFQAAEYQYKLEGAYNQWSRWSTDATVTYDNLPYGDYAFFLKARMGDAESMNIATYRFNIERPWYQSNIMIVLYALVTIGLFLGLNWFYKRYYRKQRERLLDKTKREMALETLEVEKSMVELRNQNLQKEMDARNRELAASTMSMINKSKTLNKIKEALLKLSNDDGKLSAVLALVEDNINNEEDWNFFEEAFNHADKNFFKKVKDVHPSLTANDLKLCVYLRLNMSSKEIAPLLNISHRSVEIKRYRLRKKISLPHEVNLNDYFIDL